MSLFQARSYWSTRLGTQEEFDHGHLQVANIDNDPNGDAKIIVGSFMGYVRIYYPRQQENTPDDLMCEIALDGPVLQVGVGRLISSHETINLAVLQKRKVTVYSVTSVSGAGGKQTAFNMQKAYEHALPRNACNMVIGPFGGIFGRDFLCVQSMDGVLSFFEQEASSFNCHLPNTVVPGPIAYIPKTDSFITATSALDIECYKFQSLAAVALSEKDLSLGTGKKPQREWSRCIGEGCVDIRVASFSASLSQSQVDILVLGERTLFALKEGGQIRMQKRFDDNVSAMCPYPVKPVSSSSASDTNTDNLLVANFSQMLHIYRDVSLQWSARLDSVPVDIAVGGFVGMKGLIVTLDTDGNVELSYLGTDPATNTVTASQTGKEVDFAKIDAEQRRITKLIKEAQAAGKDTTGAAAAAAAAADNNDLRLTCLEPKITCLSGGTYDENSPPSVTLQLQLTYPGPDVLQDVTVSASVPAPFVCSKSSVVVNGVGSSGVTTSFEINYPSPQLPTSIVVPITAAYVLDSGEPRTITVDARLPLRFMVVPVSPVKNVTYKLTLDTNENPPSLRALFPDMVQENSLKEFVQDNVISIEFADGHDATVVTAKNAGRYRLSGGTFHHLWLFAVELTERLKRHFKSNPSFNITYSDNLPLKDYFSFIDQHHQHRVDLLAESKMLDRRAQQLRAVQRRLLVRFKDRNPPPLKNLDSLLTLTFDQLMSQASKLQDLQSKLRASAISLSAATRLMQVLVHYRFGLDDKSAMLFNQALSAHVVEATADTAGWEEMTDASMTHLLRTSLARSAKDSSTLAQPLSFPPDTTKVKKHITLVCDRLGKGGVLIKGGSTAGGPSGTALSASASARSNSSSSSSGKDKGSKPPKPLPRPPVNPLPQPGSLPPL